MKTDLLLVPFEARMDNLLAAARAAEASGFDGIWLWDHLSGAVHGQKHVQECWTALTAIAATVPRITIGPLVLNVANRRPGVLAVMAATLQELSGGRLILGLGAGGGNDTPYASEQLMLGRKVGSDLVRRAEVAHAADKIKGLWRGDRPGFLQPSPAPPIVIGAFGLKMAALAGRVADGFNTQAGHPRLAEMIEAAQSEFSRRPDAGTKLHVSVFAPLSSRWLKPDGRDRARLESLGVDRMILLVQPPFDPASIQAAGRQLG